MNKYTEEAGSSLRRDSHHMRSEAHEQREEDYPLHIEASETLVIHCSDPRFQEAFGLFIREDMGLTIYDPLIVPGASQLLTFGSSLPKLFDALARPLRFLVRGHELKRVVIIMHEDCAWYRDFVPKFSRMRQTVKEQQKQDMVTAKRAILAEFPHIEVRMFYASINQNERVEFSEVRESQN